MIVSWNWLQDYLPLDAPHDVVERRLTMAGLNHEQTTSVGDDLAIDLEVTSNRPDCLGHLGVAREIAVLFDQPLHIPQAQPAAAGPPIDGAVRVDIESPDLCPRYTARLIRGVKVGPSPDWLVRRLATLGVATVNNVVDITNYVLLECGQPLHAFDFRRLSEGRIIVRRARPNEKFLAIDHREYSLSGEMCVIADAHSAGALGGVMGGAASEVSSQTVDVLIEAAEFDPLSIRTTSRKLVLHSDSSYRFERGVDSEGVDWASRRCCELVLRIAGGQLASGVIDVGRRPPQRRPIVLRLSQLKRIIGIDFDAAEVRRILTALGGEEIPTGAGEVTILPPSWRRDLTREIDLVEEVGRIRGYDEVPEDVGVPMAPSHRTEAEQIVGRIRRVLTAAGYDEAITASIVPAEWSSGFSPWTGEASLISNTPLLRGADHVRRSLVPSLLSVRRLNESLGTLDTWLFELAKVYLAQPDGLPREPWTLGMAAGGEFLQVKGVIEAIVESVRPEARLEVIPLDRSLEMLSPGRSCSLVLEGEFFGVLGQLTAAAAKSLGLRSQAIVAELSVDLLLRIGQSQRTYRPPAAFPAIAQDLNFIVEEKVRWSELASVVRDSAGPRLEDVIYRETFRDESKDGPGRKRLLLTFSLRDPHQTLTGEDAAAVRQAVTAACRERLGAVLVG